MNTSTLPLTQTRQHERQQFAKGIAVGLIAASIGALYTVFARWGMARGLSSADLTVLRFGVAGILMLPVMVVAYRHDAAQFTSRWRVWLLVALLAGTPFGLLMFGALQFAPPSHAAVFPFTAMSVMGMVLGAVVLGDRMTLRRIAGIMVVLTGLVLVSGVEASSLTLRAAIGDAMFLAAGTLWAGFGIVLRKHRLDPLLATAVISISALSTYVPAYFWFTGGQGLVFCRSLCFLDRGAGARRDCRCRHAVHLLQNGVLARPFPCGSFSCISTWLGRADGLASLRPCASTHGNHRFIVGHDRADRGGDHFSAFRKKSLI